MMYPVLKGPSQSNTQHKTSITSTLPRARLRRNVLNMEQEPSAFTVPYGDGEAAVSACKRRGSAEVRKRSRTTLNSAGDVKSWESDDDSSFGVLSLQYGVQKVNDSVQLMLQGEMGCCPHSIESNLTGLCTKDELGQEHIAKKEIDRLYNEISEEVRTDFFKRWNVEVEGIGEGIGEGIEEKSERATNAEQIRNKNETSRRNYSEITHR